MERASRRTRSQVAPDWTLQECLTLVNELTAVEVDYGMKMASFQKWQQVVENCNALAVNRNLNQCKRKWESLLADFQQISPQEGSYWSLHSTERKDLGLPEDFDLELFRVIDCYLKVQGKDDGGADTDPDTDPEAMGDPALFFSETVSKKKRRKTTPLKNRVEESLNPPRSVIAEDLKKQQRTSSSEPSKLRNFDTRVESSETGSNRRLEPPGPSSNRRWAPSEPLLGTLVEPSNSDLDTRLGDLEPSMDLRVEPSNHDIVETLNFGPVSKEEMIAETLRENSEMINFILKGDLAGDVNYGLADVKNAKAVHAPTRRQGDRLIDCLGKIADTLSQLCDIVEECN